MRAVSAGLWSLALAFALGAFGTHSLKVRLEPDMLEVFKTGQVYQVWASLTIVAMGLATARSGRNATVPLGLVAVGGAVFSGSLYALSLSGVRGWGMVTPVGGLLLIAGTAWAGVVFWPSINEKAPNG